MSEQIDRSQAAQLFLEFVVATSYDGAIRAFTEELEKGPGGQKPPEKSVVLHQWFNGLNSDDQDKVRAVIREAVDTAVFSLMVLLDGAAGGYPIRGQYSDFALHLQSYKDKAAYKVDTPEFSVKINPSSSDEDLHDLYRWMLEDRNSKS